VIASAKANDRLVLPSDGPRLDRKQWRAKPSLAPEFLPVLDRIKTLAIGGLTSMHVVGDFLKRRIAPLQRRVRLCCWFTSSDDIGRIQRGPRTDLSWEELELLVKGITGESFVPESLILPQDISALCDDPGLRTTILAMLPTFDESGVAFRQIGGRDPHRGIRIFDAPAGGPQSTGVAPNASVVAPSAPAATPVPWIRARGLQAVPPPQVAPGGRRKRGGTDYAALTSYSSRTPPRRVRRLLVGPRRPAPRPRARRGASVLRHHHRVRRHHNHHHHRSRRCQHHLGVIPLRGTSSSSNNSSSSSKSSGRPASKVAGRSKAPSDCSPSFFISLFIMPTGLNPSFVCQGFLPLCSQGRASPTPGCCHRDSATGLPCSSWGSDSSDTNVKRRRSGGGGPNCSDGYHSLNDGDVVEYTIGSGRGGPNCARPRHRGRRGGRVQLHPAAHSGGDGGGFWAVAPVRHRARSGAGSPPLGAVSCPSGSS
jgi:hypothetical protein